MHAHNCYLQGVRPHPGCNCPSRSRHKRTWHGKQNCKSDKQANIVNRLWRTTRSLHGRQVGKRNRVVGETLMNRDSSRSHAIFTFTVERADQAPHGAVRCTRPRGFSV